MTNAFQILKSEKTGLNSKESYIVSRGQVSFLRILGADPQWELMTATASEDHGRIQVCNSQLRLVEAALRLGMKLDTKPKVEADRMGREYVKICGITQAKSQDDEAFNKELEGVLIRFFEIYDNHQPIETRGDSEMRDLYRSLAIDTLGGDVYLSDGVWLSSDGSFNDRGR